MGAAHPAVPARGRPAGSSSRQARPSARRRTDPERPATGKDAAAPTTTSTPAPRNAAEALQALNALGEATNRCRECPIGFDATQSVFGEGPLHAPLMLVGEQPGDREDIEGRPFVGPAGRLLDRALEELGWSREAVYVTNAVKHFKFVLRGKRRLHKSPAQREAQACLHWLESEMALVRPAALVALGATAARQLLGRPVAVTRERGQWLETPDGRPVLVTLHPSALLRGDPAQREAAWTAWLKDLALASKHLSPARPRAAAHTRARSATVTSPSHRRSS